jgi:hypothetical protein
MTTLFIAFMAVVLAAAFVHNRTESFFAGAVVALVGFYFVINFVA